MPLSSPGSEQQSDDTLIPERFVVRGELMKCQVYYFLQNINKPITLVTLN